MVNKMLVLLIILIATTVSQAQIFNMTHDINWSFGALTRESRYAGMTLVGHTLLFKYDPREHNLIEVDKDSFMNCVVPPNAKVLNSGEDSIKLETPGSRYFICGIGQHCKDHEMKLQVDIRHPKMQLQVDQTKLESSSCPTHSEFVVGDDKGWNENVDYEAWAKAKDFYMGDILSFNYTQGKHNVIQVDEAAYNECTIPDDPNAALDTGSDQITLQSMNKVGFISGVGKDCENGLKLLIDVKCPHTRPNPPALQGGRKLVPSN